MLQVWAEFARGFPADSFSSLSAGVFGDLACDTGLGNGVYTGHGRPAVEMDFFSGNDNTMLSCLVKTPNTYTF